MLMNSQSKMSKNHNCDFCHYSCSKKNDYDKHISTRKHANNCLLTGKVATESQFECLFCKKKYNSRVGLWYHNKKCTESKETTLENSTTTSTKTTQQEVEYLKNIVLEVVKNNTELQKQHIELQKQVIETFKNTSNTINSHNNYINNNNKTFNLQFFLNEQCKDAMNISDFVNTFELQLEDLESVGELGYVEGITKIIVDKLNSMDIYKRPMHCSDAKREILYIKDGDKWEKEERTNPKLRKAIKTVSFKNMKIAVLWSDTYPESKDGESRLNDTYMKLIKQSTGGNGEIGDSEDKIIRRIAKEIVIDKM